MARLGVHLGAGFGLRLLFILYGHFHDSFSHVPYTDVDYKVFTDAARYLVAGESPYNRHTYRYSPAIAALNAFNILIHPVVGKVIFSLFDLVVSCLIRQIVLSQGFDPKQANWSAFMWLYNPFAMIISTRGNADAISSSLVLLSLLVLLGKTPHPVLAGIIHGISVHIRLYPIAFSLAIYFSLKPEKYSGLFNLLKPNRKQMSLVLSCLMTLVALTWLTYHLYGLRALEESIFYHLLRKDIRHNFSVYFYFQYLNSQVTSSLLVSALSRFLLLLPQVLLLVALSFIYGSPEHLAFGFCTIAIVSVAYNTVVTSQYFVWFLSLIPVCWLDVKLDASQWTTLTALWVAAQLAWLLPAYWLEFKGRDTFLYIWLQGIAFFCANMAALNRIIQAYTPTDRKVKTK